MGWLQIDINFTYEDIKSSCFSVAEPNAVLILSGKDGSFLKETQVVCWFHSGRFFPEPFYVINCVASWLYPESRDDLQEAQNKLKVKERGFYKETYVIL